MVDQGGEKERGGGEEREERRHWLVRSTAHRIRGPFTYHEIAKEIRAGTFSLRDELCLPGGKWVELFRAEPFLKVVKESIFLHGIGEKTAFLEPTAVTPPQTHPPERKTPPSTVPTALPKQILPSPLAAPLQVERTRKLITRGFITVVLLFVSAAVVIWFVSRPKVAERIPPAAQYEALLEQGRFHLMGSLPESARALFLQAQQAEPDDWRAQLFLFLLDYAEGRESVDIVNRMDRLSQLSSCGQRCRAEILNQKGIIAIDQRQYREAQQELESAVKEESTFAAAQFNLGKVYYLGKEYERARIHFEAAAELEPTVVLTYNYLGRTYDKLRRYEDALAEFQNALRINPNLLLPYLYASVMSYKLRQPEQVLEYLRTLLLQDPAYAKEVYERPDYSRDEMNYPEALKVYLLVVKGFEQLPEVEAGLALLHYLAGSAEDAKKILQGAISRFPKDAYNYGVLGYIQMEKGDREEAKESFRLALRYNFQHKLAHLLLGKCYLLDKEYELARAHFQRVLSFDNRSVLAHDGIGEVYFSLGSKESALQAWQRAGELDPTYIPSRRSFLKFSTQP